MKKLLLVLGLCAVAVPNAWAISRHDPTTMTCAAVWQTIAREGAVILRYRSARAPGLPLYDRYVDNGRFCMRGEVVFPASVPSADTAACPVQRCRVVDFGDRDRRFIFP